MCPLQSAVTCTCKTMCWTHPTLLTLFSGTKWPSHSASKLLMVSMLCVADSVFQYFFSLFIRDALPPLEGTIQPHHPPRPPPPQWYVQCTSSPHTCMYMSIFMYMYMYCTLRRKGTGACPYFTLCLSVSNSLSFNHCCLLLR